MTASTLNSPATAPRLSRPGREALELLASMRFAIALLTIICIASVIGTVVQQQQPYTNYVNQFGPFWAELFGRVGLYTVYSTWWFLLILAFLVLSTSLCIARNAPKILADLRSTKEQLREQALQAFHHRAQGALGESREAARSRIAGLLAGAGWKAKAHERHNGVMLAARRGAANKIGYLAAHSAIVLICLGGLLDGDLVVRAQMWWQDKSAFTGGGLMRDIGPQHRLSAANPTFRANLLVPEGQRAGVAIINQPRGVVLQELPFDVELKKFIVEYYETGMPKLFASEIVIHDRDTGTSTPATVKVNEPAFHRGVAIYQSSFDDGGSSLTLQALPLQGDGKAFEVHGTVGGSTTLKTGTDAPLTLEFTGLRVINVENMARGGGDAAGGTDVRRVDLAASLGEHLGSGAKTQKAKTLRNVGPSVSYKLRDAAGQAREFQNYMVPVEIEGQRVFLAGVRDNPAEDFRYLRIPADDQGQLAGWMRLRRALADPAARALAVQRYVRMAAPKDRPEMAEQLRTTADRALALFAGASADQGGLDGKGGLQALADFLETSVPEAERSRISEVLLRVVNGCLLELAQLSREREGLAPLPADEATQAFMTLSVIALSDSFHYPAPVLLALTGFNQVQASVFQVARAPGKTLVYLGAVLLIIGVFAMLYVRERRLWIWLQDDGAGRSKATMALSSTRRTLDTDREFEQLQQAVLNPPAT